MGYSTYIIVSYAAVLLAFLWIGVRVQREHTQILKRYKEKVRHVPESA